FHYAGAAASAASVSVQLDVGTITYGPRTFARAHGDPATLEIEFPAGYPAGSLARVTVQALDGAGRALADPQQASLTLASGCSTLSIELGLAARDLAGDDSLGPPDLGTDDLNADLAP